MSQMFAHHACMLPGFGRILLGSTAGSVFWTASWPSSAETSLLALSGSSGPASVLSALLFDVCDLDEHLLFFFGCYPM